MSNALYMFFSQRRIFWRVRSYVDNVHFRLGRSIFKKRELASEWKDNSLVMWGLVRLTAISIITAIILSEFLQYTNSIIYEFAPSLMGFLPESNDSNYVTFLVTISGIGGIFIGLYYAAVSAVGGSIYAKVPNNVRGLLAHDMHGSVYMRLLSFITFLGLVLVARRLLGYEQIYVAIPLMTFIAGVGIISFAHLGWRAFNLFDPAVLSRHLFRQLMHYVDRAKVSGYRWNDASFQKHANSLASKDLDTLKTLSSIAMEEVGFRGESFVELSENLVGFLVLYEREKKLIPSDSQWYEQKYKHNDWYLTKSSAISIYHQTGTSLHPDIINDKEWLEKRVIPVIRQCIITNIQEKRYSEVLSLISSVNTYLSLLARTGGADRAFDILESISISILDTVYPVSESPNIKDREVLERLAVAESIAFIPIALVLKYREHLEAFNVIEIENTLKGINWSKDGNIYKHRLPAYYLPRLEWLKKMLYFEKESEGKIVSPIWYQKEFLMKVEAEVFVNSTSAFVTKAVSMYSMWYNKALKNKRSWVVGAVLSKEWEFWHKVESQLERWREGWFTISSDRKIDGLPWPEFEYENVVKNVESRKYKLLEMMSKESLLLSLLDKPEDFPDYSGQFLHAVGEASFDALLINNKDLFKNIFRNYLYGCFMCFDRLREKIDSTDWRAVQELKVASAPLLDLMDIAGYAKLISEYNQEDELWQTVISALEEYSIFSEKKEQSYLAWLTVAIKLTDIGFEIPHRSHLRSNWKRRIYHFLSKNTKGNSKSKLVSLYTDYEGGMPSLYVGIDIFIAYYLRTRVSDDELNFTRRIDIRKYL